MNQTQTQYIYFPYISFSQSHFLHAQRISVEFLMSERFPVAQAVAIYLRQHGFHDYNKNYSLFLLLVSNTH